MARCVDYLKKRTGEKRVALIRGRMFVLMKEVKLVEVVVEPQELMVEEAEAALPGTRMHCAQPALLSTMLVARSRLKGLEEVLEVAWALLMAEGVVL